MFETCPTDVVEAPPELVWQLLTEPCELDAWVDAKLVEGPDRTTAVGDLLRFRAGPGSLFEVRWHVRDVRAPTELALRIELPFGMVNDEVVHISAMGERRCRVTLQ